MLPPDLVILQQVDDHGDEHLLFKAIQNLGDTLGNPLLDDCPARFGAQCPYINLGIQLFGKLELS